VGGLDEDLHYSLDLDLFIRLARLGSFIHLRKHLAAFRLHPASKTVSCQDRLATEHRVVWSRHTEYANHPAIFRIKRAYYKMAVAFTMAREGCLWSRFGWEKALDLPAGGPIAGERCADSSQRIQR